MALDGCRQNTLYDELRFILHRCSNAPQLQIEVYSSVVDALAKHSYLLAGITEQSWSSSTQQFQPEARVGGARSTSDNPLHSVPVNALSDGAGSTGSRGKEESRRKRRKRSNKTRAAQHKTEHDRLRQNLLPSLRRFSGHRHPERLDTISRPRPSAPHHCIPNREQMDPVSIPQGQRPPMPEATLSDRNKALSLPALGPKATASTASTTKSTRLQQVGTRPSVRLVPSVDECLTPPPSPPWMQNKICYSAAGMKDRRRW